MIITAIVTSSGSDRPACVETIHIAKNTAAANHAADVRRRKKIPIDQCGERASHMIDGRPTCIRHAGTAALNHVIATSAPPRTDEEEAASPRCGCKPEVARRVIIEGGTCCMGGCPYGGDL